MNNKGLIMARRMRVSSKIMLTLFPILLIPCLIGAALWLKWRLPATPSWCRTAR